mgnify:CR=1 FL=1
MEEVERMTEYEVNDANFNRKVIEQSEETPVIVDFYANWCMPCKILGPLLEKVVDDYEGKVDLAKCNVDEAGQSASKYGVRGIPSVKMIKNGEVVDEFTGALPEQEIRNWIDKNLS